MYVLELIASGQFLHFLGICIFFKKIFVFYIGVLPINNVVIVSGGQQGESAMHIRGSILPNGIFFIKCSHDCLALVSAQETIAGTVSTLYLRTDAQQGTQFSLLKL